MNVADNAKMTNLTFGKFVAETLRDKAGAKVIKIAYGYFDTEAVAASAEFIDHALRINQMTGEKFNPLEKLMIEILFDLCGWKSIQEAMAAHSRYLKSEE